MGKYASFAAVSSLVDLHRTRPQSSSYSTRQMKTTGHEGEGAGDDGKGGNRCTFLVFFLPISPTAPLLGTHLSLRSMKTTGDESGFALSLL